MRILVVEDNVRLAEIIRRVLKHDGLDVDLAHNGDDGLHAAISGAYDALIVDRMLPGREGLDLVRALREERLGTPVLILTARGDLPERVEGLDAGADDYLGKPFAFEELLARLRALLRRADRPLAEQRWCAGEITVDLAAHTVRRGDQDVALTHREYALLEMLVRNRHRVLSRDQILERVWGPDVDPQGNVVDLYVHYLRRKLDPIGKSSDSIIRTVPGAGYILKSR